MFRPSLRTFLQLAVICILLPAVFLIGSGCGEDEEDDDTAECGSGSDHSSAVVQHITREAIVDAGIVERYHDLQISIGLFSLGEVERLHQQGADLVIGLLVPQAPGATAPGQVVAHPDANLAIYDVLPTPLVIPLTPSTEEAQRLAEKFPPPSDTHWQALVPVNDDFLNLLPTTPFSMPNAFGYLYYQIDFLGDDVCNGCRVQLTTCSPLLEGPTGASVRAALVDAPLPCTAPTDTFIHLTDNDLAPLPGPVVAAFGLWGGVLWDTANSATATVDVALEHTSSATETFSLAPIGSAQGWTYEWQSMAGLPVDQLAVGPLSGFNYANNLRVVNLNVPTCTNVIDTIYLTATHVVTPGLQAVKQFNFQALPNPNFCTVADVGVVQVSNTEAITAGAAITYAVTISNNTDAPVSAAMTQTLSTAAAVGSTTLPAGCSYQAPAIHCMTNALPAHGATVLRLVVNTAPTYAGDLFSRVEVAPVGAADVAFLDNFAGPLGVTVHRSEDAPQSIYLPTISSQ